jgi:two-component system, LuxR family, response regulator FixJ
MEAIPPTVFVVDDESAIRNWLSSRLDKAGFHAETFASASEFLAAYDRTRPGCLILDLKMPGMGGLELQQRLLAKAITIPVIILTGCGDVDTAVRAMQANAIDFLEKPVCEKKLVALVRKAIEQDREIRHHQTLCQELDTRLQRLSPREHDVLELLVEGKPSKQIAFELGTTDHTVRKQRTSVLRKMEIDSVVNLTRTVLTVRRHLGTGR